MGSLRKWIVLGMILLILKRMDLLKISEGISQVLDFEKE